MLQWRANLAGMASLDPVRSRRGRLYSSPAAGLSAAGQSGESGKKVRVVTGFTTGIGIKLFAARAWFAKNGEQALSC